MNKIPVSEEFSILSASWILACIDKNPIMTYQSIQQRLNLVFDLGLIKALIHSRGELFRKRIPNSYFIKWKGDMIKGKHLPNWIRDGNKTKHLNMIESLNLDDVFISQFRAGDVELSYGKTSEREIIDWGLQHIERLRKASLEARDEVIRKRQMWILIIFSIINIVISIANIYINISGNK